MTTRLATTCISGPRIRAGGVANMSSPAGPILIRSGPQDRKGMGKRPTLAVSAGSPRPATTTAATSAASPPKASAASCYAASATCAAAASAASNCAPSAASAAATSAAGCKLYALAELRCSGSFLVEDIERAQADVGNLLLIERNDGAEFGISRRYIRCRHGCRCAARHGQRHPGSA